MSYNSTILADSPLAYLPMDETSGTAATDATGNGHGGTYSGTYFLNDPGPTSDGKGAVLFDGSSGKLTLDTLGSIGLGLGTSSWELWIKTTTAGNTVAFGTVNTGTDEILAMVLNSITNTGGTGASAGSTALQLRAASGGNTGGPYVTTNIYDGNWHHVVYVLSGGSSGVGPTTFKVYVDGSLVSSTYGGNPIATVDNFGFPMMIGARNLRGTAGLFCNAYIGRFACYPIALTATQVAAHYNAATGVTVPGNTVAPAISGSTTDGSTLTATTGTWTGSPTSYAYQWTRAGTNISGATSSTYKLTLLDRAKAIQCVVTATNAGGPSSPASSNSITGTAPTVVAAGKLKYAPPVQNSPTTITLDSSTNYFTGMTAGLDYILVMPSSTPRNGIVEINCNGARSVHIIGGSWALDDTHIGGPFNYHLHLHDLAGWAFIEGQEADMSLTHADFLSVSGGSLYRPDVYIQNCRVLNLTATDVTNHADIFQPQGLVGRVYVDKLTFSSNYQGFTVSPDSTGNAPAGGIKLSRINSWFPSANSVNPTTYHYWINGANGTANHDHPPFPLTFDDVWCDLTRGYGRSLPGISDVIYPSEFATGSGNAGGGTYVEGGTSVFANGEFIGAQDSGDGTYCTIPNVKMKVGGKLFSGSPSTGRSDVITDQDGSGSFVPAGIGSSYTTPGYLPRPRVGVAI